MNFLTNLEIIMNQVEQPDNYNCVVVLDHVIMCLKIEQSTNLRFALKSCIMVITCPFTCYYL